MSTAAILKAVTTGDATTFDGIRLRLHVAGVMVEHLQNALDGLVLVGTLRRSFAPAMNANVYEMVKQGKWAPEGTTEITSILAKKMTQKLDWGKPPTATLNKFAINLKKAELAYQQLSALGEKPTEFRLTSFEVKVKPVEEPALDLEKEILTVVGHDGPSTLKILQRLRNCLEIPISKLNFYNVKSTLLDMKAKGLVGYLNSTEETAAGWIQPRKNPLKKKEA